MTSDNKCVPRDVSHFIDASDVDSEMGKIYSLSFNDTPEKYIACLHLIARMKYTMEWLEENLDLASDEIFELSNGSRDFWGKQKSN